MEERNIIGAHNVTLISETCGVKNMRVNHQGFTPYQWVLGKLPVDETSLTSEEAEGRYLPVQEEIEESEDTFALRLQIRQAAKMAFIQQGRWCGPARVIGREGRATLWLIHAGVPVVASETSLRPASSTEIFTKRLLELRPSRKRMREALQEEERGREHIPFSDDYRLRDWSEGQPGYIEVPGGQGPPDEEETPQEEYTPSEPPDHMPVIPEEEETPPLPQPAAPAPERQTTEPEIEMIPATVPNTPVQAAAPEPTPLQQAMHRNLNALDGHPSSISPEVKKALDGTRGKEWNNWKQFEAVFVVPPDEKEKFLADHPEAVILPTRWVDVNKAEQHEEPRWKSRLVVRGDLEKNNDLRTDSPTTSQLILQMIISLAAATGTRLRAGDISAAFLQGTGITRVLAMSLPKGGIPDAEVQPGSLLVARKSVYGTRDAPRGFWKALHDTLLRNGLKPYYLPGEQGQVAGLLGCHVDDLLWAGSEAMQKTMEAVQAEFKFGLVESDELKYCGRIIHQGKDGITITCPSVLDRTKPIYVSPQRRRHLGEVATPAEISQLRSVVGSLSWLARVCRPDLSFQVNQLQARQQAAQVRHLVDANKLLHHALQDRNKGIFYAKGAMEFESAILLSINDASHAASVEAIGEGIVAGHRSESGRILAMANPSFATTGTGPVYLLEWHSNTIRRVCRSTLQAETRLMQLGSEESEHVRQVIYEIKNEATETPKNERYTKAMDSTKSLWLTDCRSLSDHLTNTTGGEVSDKRLPIDLTSLRQEVWRRGGESVGNPTYTDSLPAEATTQIRWISTKTMVADGLTKAMKAEQLDHLMKTGHSANSVLKQQWRSTLAAEVRIANKLGPATVTELASFLCEEYGVDTQVRRLVDFRATWIMPMTNAFGYAAHRREENSMDPNRDFPYLHTRPERCMQTQTARAVNELFRRHLFQFMITFHGGMRALTYEWGSRNHMTMPQRRSTEPPDETAFREVGQAIQAAAGKTLHRRWFYPLGRINDLVYPVEGGMEDWSYAAGWEKSPTPITVCKPNTYGGYAEERTKYRRDSISTLVYLAEMDNYKTAPDNSLGHRLEIWSPSATNGHIARNLRMCLKTIEMTRPEVVVLPPSMPSSAGDGATSLSVQIYGFGCHQMTARLVAVPSSVVPGCLVGEDGGDLEQEQFQQILQKSVKMDATEGHCRGLSLWNASTPPPRVLQGAVPTGEEVCVLIAAEFDQQWARQTRPDPLVTPRSHAARGRLEERYQVKANDGPMMIKARRTKLFAPWHIDWMGEIGGGVALEQPKRYTSQHTARKVFTLDTQMMSMIQKVQTRSSNEARELC
ncbi:Retrovirus-related Pol polyprotein from transposon RE2 (Retro element 2) (AtRE2) [Includes: Protease RE2 [Durusdinium trenchii]|uniref:Retrovirus-related Pol polyprotein from transposon RE2 (Retro element 2) (AtRE2) n=1 Tax=Durusdinium trenchii TaxID=1381693 RepID=A0ABP0I1U8_9DINO